MTKPQARERARQLRTEGMSLKDIAKLLGVAKSSVSLWVRDVELSADQYLALREKYHHYDSKLRGSQTNRQNGLARRTAYQQEGRTQAREGDPLHLAGCMLYWAEGTKNRTAVKFVNSDPDMMRLFVNFLRQSLLVPNEKMFVHINCYTGNGLTLQEIETFWLDLLGLPRTSLRPSLENHQPRSSNQRGRKLIYGVCTLSVYSTRYVQHIFGAIQEYSGVDKPEWLL